MTDLHNHWTDRLNTLMAQADHAAAAGDLTRILELVEHFRGFIAQSPDNSPGISELDQGARGRVERLLSRAIAASLHDLAARSASHEGFADQLHAAADDAQHDALALRLEPMRRAIPVVHEVIKLLRAAMGESDSTVSRALAAAERLLEALQEAESAPG